MDIVTDDLKRKLANANGKVKEIERERTERRKVHMTTKVQGALAPGSSSSAVPSGSAVANVTGGPPSEDVAMADAQEAGKGKEKAPELAAGELEDETILRERESKEFEASIDPELRADTGASVTGLFELCGMAQCRSLLGLGLTAWLAIVTHKGASADSGHYIGFVKKDAFHPPKSYLEENNQDCKFLSLI